MIRWWHRAVLGHTQTYSHVSPPLWDRFTRGDLYRCSCGQVWAK